VEQSNVRAASKFTPYPNHDLTVRNTTGSGAPLHHILATRPNGRGRTAALGGRRRQKEGDMALAQGDQAPDFTLPRDGGGSISLSSLKGRKVVLYAYPKDDTPGCTQEAIAFNGLRKAFAEAGTEILGISPDAVKSHDKFKKKHGLDFALAADETQDALQAYGIWVEKSMYGRTYMGVERTTFLIDKDGRIARIWPKVKVAGHAEEVLAAAQAL
jgi:peroxiredoxin Q/BCP